MTGQAGYYTEKPHRLDSSTVSDASRLNMDMAAAGDVHTHHMDATKTRGSAELCRYHVYKSVKASPGGGKLSPRSSIGCASARVEKEPLSCDEERHRVRRLLQEIMQNKAELSVAKLDECIAKKAAGWEKPSARPLTPCRTSTEAFRFHSALPKREVREAPYPKEDSYQARQGCRFHASTSPRQRKTRDSFSQDTSWADKSGVEAAGCVSDSRRLDTPGGQATSLGRARSTTPDYHRRYGSNLSGSSLPGSRVGAPQTPRPVRRVSAYNPRNSPLTTTSNVKHLCRYHQEDTANLAKRRSQDASMTLTSTKDCGDSSMSTSFDASVFATPPSARTSPRGSTTPTPAERTPGGNVGSPAVRQWSSLREGHLGTNGGANRSHAATSGAARNIGNANRRHPVVAPSNGSDISGISVADSNASFGTSLIRPIATSGAGKEPGRMLSFVSDTDSHSCRGTPTFTRTCR